MKGSEGVKRVKHYHWTGWTDLEAPGHHTIDIFNRLLELNLKVISEKKRLMIHCSAGIGRTGTLGVLTDAVRWFNEEEKISIYALVEYFRNQRIWCVQTFAQYRFIYKFMKGHLK